MNEVEKMYSNAEPNRDCNLYKHFTECPMKHTQCEDCENFVYPPFTAEKQLELIKWLANYDEVCRMEKIRDGWFIEIDMITSELSSTFKEALANLINKIWQDLTEKERKQIKEILE